MSYEDKLIKREKIIALCGAKDASDFDDFLAEDNATEIVHEVVSGKTNSTGFVDAPAKKNFVPPVPCKFINQKAEIDYLKRENQILKSKLNSRNKPKIVTVYTSETKELRGELKRVECKLSSVQNLLDNYKALAGESPLSNERKIKIDKLKKEVVDYQRKLFKAQARLGAFALYTGCKAVYKHPASVVIIDKETGKVVG